MDSLIKSYPAHFQAPFGLLGIRCEGESLCAIEFITPDFITPYFMTQSAPEKMHDPFVREVCQQLQAYFADATFKFKLAVKLTGTAHQRKVWQAIRDIPVGRTRQYGELAALLDSSARAVGGACGKNPVPIIIPCHRVLSKSGLGGFNQQSNGSMLDIKRWLLAHEQRRRE